LFSDVITSGCVTPDEYVEEVLALVERIPPGRAMSYGAVADALASRSGRSSARLVGSIMARYGAAVPWHRVVAANGRLVPGHEAEATARHVGEATPMRPDGRVDMRKAAWFADSR
jgi:methylated-DNA-protein-cysteine methyltransferase related protein